VSKEEYPRVRLKGHLVKEEMPPSWRIFPNCHADTPLGMGVGPSRLRPKDAGYRVAYMASDFPTAFIETIPRDSLTGNHPRRISWVEICGYSWVLVGTAKGKKMTWLDLRGTGCLCSPAPTDALRARNHVDGQALGNAIYSEHEDIDGIIWDSRLTVRPVRMVFDRRMHKLKEIASGKVHGHPSLWVALAECNAHLGQGPEE